MHEAVAFLLTFAEFFLPLKLLVIYQANVFPIFNEKVVDICELRIANFEISKLTSMTSIQKFE